MDRSHAIGLIPAGEPMIERQFPATPRSLRDIREFARETAQTHTFTRFVDDIGLAVNEACANAIVHSGGPKVTVRIEAAGGRLVVEVVDTGTFRARVPVPEFDGEGRRGLHLMMALMDEVDIRPGTLAEPGTVVRLVKFKR